MIKIVKATTLAKMEMQVLGSQISLATAENAIIDANRKISKLEEENTSLVSQLRILEETLDQAEQSVKQLSNPISDENTVTLTISEDLETITPTVKHQKNLAEKLMQEGRISESSRSDDFSVQLALMMIAEEALGQLIDSFSPNMDSVG